MAGVDQQHGKPARLQQYVQRYQIFPVDSMATVSTLHGIRSIGQAQRIGVKLLNSRTGSSSRSGGTATKWDALPISMPAALGVGQGRWPTLWWPACVLPCILHHVKWNVAPPARVRRLDHSLKRDACTRPNRSATGLTNVDDAAMTANPRAMYRHC